MRFVDAHIHLADPDYNSKLLRVIRDVRGASVVALVLSAMDFRTSVSTLDLAGRFPRLVYASIGLHPWNALTSSTIEVDDVVKLIFTNRSKIVAVGEIGLDSHYTHDSFLLQTQLRVFQKMLETGERTLLPVVVHSRGTALQVLETLSSYRLRSVLLHWYSGSADFLKRIFDSGYYISEGPSVLYSSGIQEIIKQTPLANLLTETDGPVRYRGVFKGRLTTSAFLPEVVEKIAEIKGEGVEMVAEKVLQNFKNLFNIPLANDK